MRSKSTLKRVENLHLGLLSLTNSILSITRTWTTKTQMKKLLHIPKILQLLTETLWHHRILRGKSITIASLPTSMVSCIKPSKKVSCSRRQTSTNSLTKRVTSLKTVCMRRQALTKPSSLPIRMFMTRPWRVCLKKRQELMARPLEKTWKAWVLHTVVTQTDLKNRLKALLLTKASTRAKICLIVHSMATLASK